MIVAKTRGGVSRCEFKDNNDDDGRPGGRLAFHLDSVITAPARQSFPGRRISLPGVLMQINRASLPWTRSVSPR